MAPLVWSIANPWKTWYNKAYNTLSWNERSTTTSFSCFRTGWIGQWLSPFDVTVEARYLDSFDSPQNHFPPCETVPQNWPCHFIGSFWILSWVILILPTLHYFILMLVLLDLVHMLEGRSIIDNLSCTNHPLQ